MRVDASADGGATERQFAEICFQLLKTLNTVLNLAGVTAELLTQPNRRGVLQMRAADFEDAVECLGLRLQRGMQLVQRRDEFVRDGVQRGEMNGGGNHVVAGLAAVDVVV